MVLTCSVVLVGRLGVDRGLFFLGGGGGGGFQQQQQKEKKEKEGAIDWMEGQHTNAKELNHAPDSSSRTAANTS